MVQVMRRLSSDGRGEGCQQLGLGHDRVHVLLLFLMMSMLWMMGMLLVM